MNPAKRRGTQECIAIGLNGDGCPDLVNANGPNGDVQLLVFAQPKEQDLWSPDCSTPPTIPPRYGTLTLLRMLARLARLAP